MISSEINKDDGIVIIEPSGSLEQSDFENLAREIDTHLNDGGEVNGILIHAKQFPGWKDFSAFTHHISFVKNHHRKVKRVAAVTDSKFLSIVPNIAKHFVSADVKHFEYDDMESAKQWIREAV